MSIFRKLKFKIILAITILGFASNAVFSENNKENIYLDMVKGNSDAKVTIVEYASFTCPYCATFHKEIFPQLKEQYIDTGKVKFIYREVYFDAPGLWGGLLARCVSPKKYGRQIGMEDEQINKCMQNKEKSLKMIDAYLENSKIDKISSTPSLVINGKLLKPNNFDDLAVEIDKILE